MPKFDFILQNPPYNKSLHLDFFNKGLDLLSDTGKMVIIEPSTWLIELRQNIAKKKSSQMKKYIALKERIKGHVNKIIVENFNNEFNVGLYVPCSITYIDKSKEYKQIEYSNCGIKKYVNSLYDCNLIGNIEIIKSIFEKIKNCDIVDNHLYIPNKSEKIEGKYYIRYAGIIGCCGCSISDPHNGFNYNSDAVYSLYNKNICLQYTASLYGNKFNDISDSVHFKIKRGSTIGTLTDKEANCVTGTKQELENWKHYVFNNSIPLFINICLTINQHNNSLHYVPWLVDKQYTDKEIYDMFGFTDEEIKLIETTIKKYERYSPWFKRYMCGPSSVTNEEVQNFINELENA